MKSFEGLFAEDYVISQQEFLDCHCHFGVGWIECVRRWWAACSSMSILQTSTDDSPIHETR